MVLMLKLLSEMFLANWKIIVLVAALGGGYWYISGLREDLNTATTTITSLETERDALKAESESLRKQRKEDIKNLNNAYEDRQKAQLELQKTKSLLDKAKTKEPTVAKKAGLITIKTNKKNREFERRVACETGNTAYCS